MSNKAAATYHPHPSYTAMEAAWDPVRRAAYPGTLASLTPPDRPNDAWAKTDKPVIMARDIKPAWAGDLARQRRNKS